MPSVKSDIEAESNNNSFKLNDAMSVQCSLKSIINYIESYDIQYLIDILFEYCLNYNKISLIGIWIFLALITVYAQNNIRLTIDVATIRRCFLLIQKRGLRMSANTPNYAEIACIKTVINDHFKHIPDLPELDLDIIEFNNPLEDCANSYIINLHQHIIRNFFKYQYKYLVHKIQVEYPNLNHSDKKLLATVIQRKLLGKEYIPRKTTQINKLEKLKEKISDSLDNFIKGECLFLDKYFNDSEKYLMVQDGQLLNSENVGPDTVIIFLSYMWAMLDYIKSTDANSKGFDIVPLFTPKMRMFRFEAPILCTIYNMSKDNLTFKDRIKVPDFKKNKVAYFDEMFNVRTRFKKIMKRFPYVNSIVTDGNRVSLTFLKSPPTIRKKKTEEEKELAKENKKTKDKIKADANLIRNNKLKDNQKSIDCLSKQISIKKTEYKTILDLQLECMRLSKKISEIDKILLTGMENNELDQIIISLVSLSDKHKEAQIKLSNFGVYTHAFEIKKLIDELNEKQTFRKKILGQPPIMNLEELIKNQYKKYSKNRIEFKGKHMVNLEETLYETFQPTGLYEVESLTAIESNILNKYSIFGADPGNNPMTYFSGKNGIAFKFNKNEYNDAALITKNKEKNEALREKENMNEITRELSETTHKTSDLNDFIKYTEIVLKYWNKIWDFYSSIRILQIKLEMHISSQKAISLMAHRIIERMKDPKNRGPYYKKHKINISEEEIHKPIILFYGTGNGNMTVSNTKNSSSKGPIKRLIHELSKYIIVILVNEYNTSQLCHLCHEKMEGVDTYHFPSFKKLKKNLWNKSKNGNITQTVALEELNNPIKNIEMTKMLRQKIGKLKKDRNNQSKIEIEQLETKVREIKCGRTYTYQSSYHLRTCANQHENNKNVCKMYDRNLTGSSNIMTVGIWELTTKDRGKYKRIPKSIE
jgi:hypothetical protein